MSSRHTIRLFWPVLATLLATPTPGHSQPLPERRRLTGRIVAGDGKPCVEENFQLVPVVADRPMQVWSVAGRTDGNGDFSLPDVEEGAYHIVFGADKQVRGPQEFTLDDTHMRWNIVQVQFITVTVTLLNAAGQPAANVSGHYELKRRGELRASAFTTDNEGAFSIENVESGTYDRLAADTLSAGYAVQPQFAVPPGAGQSTLRLQPGGTLRVRVLGTAAPPARADAPIPAHAPAPVNARPLGGITLSLSSADAGDADAAPTEFRFATNGPSEDGSGEALFDNLPPGRYTLGVGKIGNVVARRNVTVALGATAETTVYLPAVDAPTLVVTLLDPQGRPLPNRPVTLVLQAEDRAGESRAAHSDLSGNIALYPVQPGQYTLHLWSLAKDRDFGKINGMGTVSVTVTPAGAAATATIYGTTTP